MQSVECGVLNWQCLPGNAGSLPAMPSAAYNNLQIKVGRGSLNPTISIVIFILTMHRVQLCAPSLIDIPQAGMPTLLIRSNLLYVVFDTQFVSDYCLSVFEITKIKQTVINMLFIDIKLKNSHTMRRFRWFCQDSLCCGCELIGLVSHRQ